MRSGLGGSNFLRSEILGQSLTRPLYHSISSIHKGDVPIYTHNIMYKEKEIK